MLTLNDLVDDYDEGTCWRFLPGGPDTLPTVSLLDEPDDLPAGWAHFSGSLGYLRQYGHYYVELLEHYTTCFRATPMRTAVQAPLDQARRTLIDGLVDGLSGAQCLARYERAQQTESLARTPAGWVSTNADCALNERQVEAARVVWQLTLAAKRTGVAERQRLQVRVDIQDED